jgi:[acyl-carrier-protein] S-malonyltransferase
MKTAYIFPGQGSQVVGMLKSLYATHPMVEETFLEADAVLGYSLSNLILSGPAEQLNRTECTQPALLTVSVALWRAGLAAGIKAPDFLAGHSLGEYSAWVCSGALLFADALKLVSLRGQLMQEAVPTGVGLMYAIIGLSDDKVRQACQEAQQQWGVVSPANYNSPGQVVIAGKKIAVEAAAQLCKALGAKRTMQLSVSTPSHCELMRPAAFKLEQALADVPFFKPKIPVINNVDVAIETEAHAIREALIQQLYSPVRWTHTIEHLAQKGVTSMMECGSGKVLAGLNRRIDKSISVQSMPQELENLTLPTLS